MFIRASIQKKKNRREYKTPYEIFFKKLLEQQLKQAA